MQESRKFSRLVEVTFTIDREDMVQLLQTAARIPGGFEVAKSSIDGDWPLVITVSQKLPLTQSNPEGQTK